MRIYFYADSLGWCTMQCKHSSYIKIGSVDCQNCEHNEGYNKIDDWVDCAKESGMKVETAELQFIRDDKGRRNFITEESGDRVLAVRTPEEAHEWLVHHKRLTPNPLEKALEAVDTLVVNQYTNTNYATERAVKYISASVAKEIIRTFAEEIK